MLVGALLDMELALLVAFYLPDDPAVFIFSGYRGSVFNTVLTWKPPRHGYSAPAGPAWREATSMMTPRIDCAVVPFGGDKVLFAGGVDGHPYRSTPEQSAFLYDSLTNTWDRASPMAGPRHGCAGIGHEGAVYVAGGQYPRQPDTASTIERYDPATNAWATVAVRARDLRVIRTKGVARGACAMGCVLPAPLQSPR